MDELKEPEERIYEILKTELDGNLFGFVSESLKDHEGLFFEDFNAKVIKCLSVLGSFAKNPEKYESSWVKWAKEQNKELRKLKKVADKLGGKLRGVGRIKYLLENEKPDYKSLGCGIHLNPDTKEEFMYFGTKIYEGEVGFDAIVTSNKKVLVAFKDDNQIKHMGINYRFPFFDSILDYSWSNNTTEYSINNFIFGEEKKVSLKKCYEDILKNMLYFMDFQDDMMYVSKSCDILSSFFLPIFEAKGRTFDNAEKSSGKTKDAMLYDLQIFNPLMSADITGPSFFRAVESTACSIIIDDFDAVPEEKKIPLIQLCRTGYKKGQKAVRTSEGKVKLPESYNIFSNMYLNNVGGLDEITADRCNTYQLIKSTDSEKVNRKINEKDPKWQIQRDKRYYCALQNWMLVGETYNKLVMNDISGRDLEKIAPILTIGSLVLDKNTYKQLVKYEKSKIEKYKDRDVSTDWLFIALKEVVEMLKKSTENEKKQGIWVRLDRLDRWIVGQTHNPQDRDYEKNKRFISIYLGKIFKNTPLFESGKVHGGYVKYLFEPVKLIKFLEIRDYLNYFTKEELMSILPPSIQSIPSHPSIQSIQSIH